jgi:hypothetical protein
MSDDEDDEKVSDESIREAFAAIKGGQEIALRDVLTLAAASFERERPYAPAAVTDAVAAKWECDADFANGGADQFAWNHGVAATRAIAAAFRKVGAIENADLLDRLARELEAYGSEVKDLADDPVRRFLEYRKRVGGPFFGLPEPGDELAEALVEYAHDHPDEFSDQ